MKLRNLSILFASFGAACGGGASATPADQADAGGADGGTTTPPADAAAPAHDANVEAAGPRSAFDIPISPMTNGPNGTFSTVQISVGDSPPFTAFFDTGSVGLRVITGTVPDSAWTVTATAAASETYGSGVTVGGSIANAFVTIGGVKTTKMIAVEDVTSATCTASAPNCEAAGKTIDMFRFRGQFNAILGVGMRASKNLASPLAALGTHAQYILAFGAFGDGAGVLHVDPSAAEIARFNANLVHLTTNGQTSASGVPGWLDTQVPFCLNAFCATGIIDTGGNAAKVAVSTPADYAALGIPDGSTSFPAGTVVTGKLATNASWTFTVGTPAVVGKDAFVLGAGTAIGNNLGPIPFYQRDVFFDFTAGTIGFAPKQ